MIYVTGDMHGNIKRFKSREVRRLKRGDYLLVCGDFGFIWDGSDSEKKLLKWIGKRRYYTLFVDGANDNHSLIDSYEEVPFCGGIARKINGNLYYMMRGQVYDIEGKKIFAMGGGEKPLEAMPDITLSDGDGQEIRLATLPSPEALEQGFEELRRQGGRVDYIISHDAPLKLKDFLQLGDGEYNHLGAFFDRLVAEIDFEKWFFGCHHMDKIVPPRYFCMYKAVRSAYEAGQKKQHAKNPDALAKTVRSF